MDAFFANAQLIQQQSLVAVAVVHNVEKREMGLLIHVVLCEGVKLLSC